MSIFNINFPYKLQFNYGLAVPPKGQGGGEEGGGSSGIRSSESDSGGDKFS